MEPVSVVVPTINEADNVGRLISLIEGVFKSSGITGEIVVIDDSSADGTADIARRTGAGYGNVRVVVRQRRDGLGNALRRGVEEASYDHIVFMDADLSHDPGEIPNFIRALGEFDMVVGSRFMQGSKMRRGFARKMISGSYNIVSRTMLGVGVCDITSGFKAFSRRKVASLSITARGPEMHPELVIKASLGGLRVGEIPVAYTDRVSGKSKLNYAAIFPGYSRVLLEGLLSKAAKLFKQRNA
jgi:dolichol-phosphate mannosyltransferase